MDEKFWIYIIIGVIYLISRVLKKSGGQTGEAPKQDPAKPVRRYETPEQQRPSAPTAKPMTFEELLREISAGKTPQQQEVVDYDDNIPEEAQDLEEVEYDYRKKDRIYDVYDEGKRQAFARPSLEETMRVEDTVMKYGKFKEFEIAERKVMSGYLTALKDPDGLKKAVVMSEILKRKF
ncbi:MAG TPA: hypothetical protein VD816_05610 [Ohtaekwangia sp.]|nr:hypothetical protein [Ohtaekwangia sp.]